MVEPRETLARLIRERGDDYVSLSRMLGRNAAYIQQFIRRGVPRKLDEDDRRTLARYFGVSETLLGAPEADMTVMPIVQRDLITIPRLAIGASAGPGSVMDDEAIEAMLAVDPIWMRRLTPNIKSVSMIAVSGDSMVPTLADGDDIIVDQADSIDRLRDGIYVLRIDDVLNVKRVALNPATRTLSIVSDNPAYPSWSDCPLDKVDFVGRVIWVGRKLS